MASETKTRILIVEDEAIVAADIEDGLIEEGYEISGIAVTGEDAIGLAERSSPDLILMDIRLQGKMTGVEAASEIASRFQIPFIFLTALSDDVTLERAKLTQPFGYLLKPFGRRELHVAIETALYKSQTERKLHESDQWNRLIVETVYNAVISMDHEGKISDWNPSAEKMFGWKKSEVEGRPFEETIVPESLREQHYRGLRTGVAPTPILNRLIESRGLHRNGHEFPIELTISPVQFGGQLRFLAFINDISERQQLEIEKKRKEELERSNEELDRFARITSHDLKAPLSTIAMYIELLDNEFSDTLSDTGKQYTQCVIHTARRMSCLIDDLLAYTRVGTNAEAVFESVDVGSSVQTALENLKASIVQSKAQIIQGRLPIVSANRNQLSLLFQNLIGNAIKFRNETPPIIQINSQRKMDFWLISVKDNGIGFESKWALQIFDAFKRAHGDKQYPGTGIGLAICKKIVLLHGGRIWAESIPNKGTTFYFTLPAIDATSQI